METAVRIFKVRRISGYEQDCQICEGPISFQQQICITSALRTVHLGCLVYEQTGNTPVRYRPDHQPSLFEE